MAAPEYRPVHVPVMVREVIDHLRPAPGEVALDCTLGGGGHARAILSQLQPGGRLIGLDVDSRELQQTERVLRLEGFSAGTFTVVHASFSDARQVLAAQGIGGVDVICVDLGISTMQADDAARGFHYKVPGPLDMRMNAEAGQPASDLLAAMPASEVEELLRANADEPRAALIAGLITRQPITTTQALERTVRLGLAAAVPGLTKAAIKSSVRRTFQALRIAVNQEFPALDTLLAALPELLNPGGRVVVLTFHSGEDRRVKQAFRAGSRQGIYSAIARTVTRSSKEETRTNRRSSSCKLRWAVRSPRV